MRDSHIVTRPPLQEILPIAALIALEIIAFGNVAFSDAMLGEGDGQYCMLATEHWFRVLTGRESLLDYGIFFPQPRTVTWSDLFLGYAPMYCLLRIVGISQFASFKATMVAVHIFGVICTYILLRKLLRIGSLASFVGTTCFAFGNMICTTFHPQLLSIFFIPFMAICFNRWFTNREKPGPSRMLWGCLAVITWEIMFYTAGYVGYFVILFGLVFVVASLIVLPIANQKMLRGILTYAIRHLKDFLVFIGLFVVMLIPYIYLYSLGGHSLGGRDWEGVAPFLMSWSDYLDSTGANLLWGTLLGFLPPVQTGESYNGFPPLFLASFVVATGATIASIVSKRIGRDHIVSARLCVYGVLGIAAVISLLLVLVLPNGFTLWSIAFLIPGASAMRAVERFTLVTCFFMALVVAFAIDELASRIHKVVPRQSLIVLLGVLVVVATCSEHVWLGNQTRFDQYSKEIVPQNSTIAPGTVARWTESEKTAMLDSVPAPPSDCVAFYLENKDKEMPFPDCLYLHLDAWLIANEYNIKTLNGYGSYYPSGWELANDIGTPATYDYAMRNWVSFNALQGVYTYNLDTHEWKKVS